jgi:hypothetical protein
MSRTLKESEVGLIWKPVPGGEALVKVIDLDGKALWEGHWKPEPGTNILHLDTSAGHLTIRRVTR